MTNNCDYQNRIVELAKDILLLSRNSLLVNLRFLDVALSQFELIPQSEDNPEVVKHPFPTIHRIDRIAEFEVLDEHFRVPYADRLR